MKITLYTEGLTASADDRTLSGVMLPFGEPGRTSIGKVTVAKGALTVAPIVLANMEHDRTRPAGTLVAHEETDTGLMGTIRVTASSIGTDLLVEAAEGLRTGLSVEVDNPVVKAGALVSGTITGVAFCTRPAFDSARLTATAADTEPPKDDDEDDQDPADDDTKPDDENDDADDTADDEDDPKPDENGAPPVTASALAGQAGKRKNKPMTLHAVAEALATANHMDAFGRNQMLAALSDIVSGGAAGITGKVEAPGFLGELWSPAALGRTYVPLMSNPPLTSWTVKGWKWGVKPTVAAYAGDKAQIPSNTPTVTQVSVDAARIAGGHDIDRKFFDFGNTEFIQSYLRVMAESYADVSDGIARDFLLANATAIGSGAVPSGALNATYAIIDAILAVMNNANRLPDWVVVGQGLWRSSLGSDSDNALALISQAMGFQEGSIGGLRIIPGTAAFPDGKVMAGVRSATRFMELPGVPIRVEAEDIAKGGKDEALFGYHAEMLDDAKGLYMLTAQPATIDAGADFAISTGTPTKQLVVLAVFADGTKADVTAECTFSSSDVTKATVSAGPITGGLVTKVAAGTAVITATYPGTGVTDTVTATVS